MNTKEIKTRNLMRHLLLLALLVFCSYWIFIDIYRINAFNTVPIDDYAPYLLYILGEEGGNIPGSPFAYRLFSVAAAVPFYYILPFFKFSLLENVDLTYLRAVEALAMVAYVSMLASCALVYLIITKRFGGSGSSGLIGSLAALLVLQFSGYTGVDPIAILMVCLLIYYSRSPIVFGLLIIISVGFNEKVSLVLSMLMVSRVVFLKDKRFLLYAILSVLAFVIYLSMRTLLDIPGGEVHMEFMRFPVNAISNFSNLATLKRFVLDIAPVMTLVIFYVLAANEKKLNPNRHDNYFSAVDISALLGLFLIVMGTGMRFNIGRVSMFCFPFYLPLAAVYIERLVLSLDTDTVDTQ